MFHSSQADDGWEEVFDFIFPEDESQKPNRKILETAKAWMKKKTTSEETPQSEDITKDAQMEADTS